MKTQALAKMSRGAGISRADGRKIQGVQCEEEGGRWALHLIGVGLLVSVEIARAETKALIAIVARLDLGR